MLLMALVKSTYIDLERSILGTKERGRTRADLYDEKVEGASFLTRNRKERKDKTSVLVIQMKFLSQTKERNTFQIE